MIFFGIDQSFSETGIYCSNGNFALIKSDKELNHPKRIIYIWEQIYKFMKSQNDNDMYVGEEGLSFGSRGMLAELGGLHYFIKAMLEMYKIPYITIPPNSWKKYLMKQKLNKEGKNLIILETFKRYSIEIKNDNLCDAFNIMKFTEAIHAYKVDRVEETEFNKEIFKKVPLQ